jgi:hypothetical protein
MPEAPSFLLHTGDLTHLSKPEEFDTLQQELTGVGAPVFYVPGEHDVLNDNGKSYLERYGKNTQGAGWYSFDQAGVHFIGLVNVVDLKAGGLGALGAEQLAWLEKDVKRLKSSTPIVVFAHIPLWSVYPEWGWGTDDSARALAYLKRFGSVSVLNGHIHQVMQKVEGNVTFHTAMSTAFPQPAPGAASSPGPMKVEDDRLKKMLGLTAIAYHDIHHPIAITDLPLESDHDGDNLICDGYGAAGYLARVNGVEAFLETRSNDNKNTLRVVPLVNGHWANACAVEADFATKYAVSAVYTARDGPVSETDIRGIAAQIVEQRAAVADPKSFHFGPPLSEPENEIVRTMNEIVSKMDGEPVPAFGREKELQFNTIRDADSYPLILNNKTYLLRIGQSQLGCCYFSDPILILYALKDGKPQPIASAFVEQSQGAIESLKATVSR